MARLEAGLAQADTKRAEGRNDVSAAAEEVTMKPGQTEHCIECLRALYSPPMTDDERAAYDSLRAAEMARAEARRQPSPQLDLGEAV